MKIEHAAGKFAAIYAARNHGATKGFCPIARSAYMQAKPGHRIIAMNSAMDRHAQKCKREPLFVRIEHAG